MGRTVILVDKNAGTKQEHIVRNSTCMTSWHTSPPIGANMKCLGIDDKGTTLDQNHRERRGQGQARFVN